MHKPHQQANFGGTIALYNELMASKTGELMFSLGLYRGCISLTATRIHGETEKVGVFVQSFFLLFPGIFKLLVEFVAKR